MDRKINDHRNRSCDDCFVVLKTESCSLNHNGGPVAIEGIQKAKKKKKKQTADWK